MSERRIAPVADNREKQQTYKDQMRRYSKAMREEFFFEAILIDYAMLEDRLRSMLYHAALFANRDKAGCWKKTKPYFQAFVKQYLETRLNAECEPIDTAIELCLYTMKTQVFNDGNKRAAVIYANHYLIAHAGGLLVIPEKEVPDFKRLLVTYYEDKDQGEIKTFLKEKCWKRMEIDSRTIDP